MNISAQICIQNCNIQNRNKIIIYVCDNARELTERNVRFLNLSEVGFIIETQESLCVDDEFELSVSKDTFHSGLVVWGVGELFFCAFHRRLSEAELSEIRARSQASHLGTQTPADGSYEKLCTRLHRLRLSAGLTLGDVATALEVSKPTVWAWEKDKSRPAASRIKAIAKFFNVGVDELVIGAQRKNNCENTIAKYRQIIAGQFGIDACSVKITIEL